MGMKDYGSSDLRDMAIPTLKQIISGDPDLKKLDKHMSWFDTDWNLWAMESRINEKEVDVNGKRDNLLQSFRQVRDDGGSIAFTMGYDPKNYHVNYLQAWGTPTVGGVDIDALDLSRCHMNHKEIGAMASAWKNDRAVPLSFTMNAAKIAEEGFKIPSAYAGRIRVTARDLRKFKSSTAIMLDDKGSPRKAGELLKQPDLAKTYRAIASNGIGWFYGGPFAAATEKWMKANGGIMTARDLANYKPRLREPVRVTYRGHEIISMPPPSSGGVHVGQILNILENFDLKKMGANSTDFIHLVTEAMKLAFADRANASRVGR